MRRALTESDNASSAALWNSLGDPDARVQALLAATGDPATRPWPLRRRQAHRLRAHPGSPPTPLASRRCCPAPRTPHPCSTSWVRSSPSSPGAWAPSPAQFKGGAESARLSRPPDRYRAARRGALRRRGTRDSADRRHRDPRPGDRRAGRGDANPRVVALRRGRRVVSCASAS